MAWAGIKAALGRIASATRTVFKGAASLARHVIGEVRWQAPSWPRQAWAGIVAACRLFVTWVQHNRKRAAWSAVVAAAVIGGGVAGKWWYDHLPKPVEAAFEFTQPGRTR